MIKPRVYSYLRFSDPRQASGSSAARQEDYAARWAAEHGLALDTSLSLRDEGLSAYHQAHVTRGALGVFLAAIDAGQVAAGSVLVVEGLDRLSRAEPLQAQGQLAQIINAGVTVVTASDGREYNRERLRAQPMDLVYSLLVMIRAHEESDTKSRRVRAAIRRQVAQWQAGTYRGRIRVGTDPAWVRWDGAAWAFVPERAEAVREAVAMFRRGEGGVRIVRALAERGVVMRSAALYKTFRNPALRGVKRLSIEGEDLELEGYYPALLSDEAWGELQHAIGNRTHRRGRGEIPGIVTGLGITWCGYCGASMVGQNLMTRRQADGSMLDGHRRMICCGHAHGSGCEVGGSCSVVPVERALIEYCSDQLNLSALLDGGDRAQGLRAALARVRSRVATTEAQLERVTEALLSSDGPAPAVITRQAAALEKTLADDAAEAAQLERELARVASTETPALAAQWARLAEQAHALDVEARLRVRQLVADTFERLVVWHRGVEEETEGVIDVALFAKGGGGRMLRIHRRSGELLLDLESWQPGAGDI